MQNNDQSTDFNSYLNAASNCADQGKYSLAITRLDKAFALDQSDMSSRWWYYYYKAYWFECLLRYEDALKTINEGLLAIDNPPILLYLKADIVLRGYKDYQQCNELINNAEFVFSSNSQTLDVQEEKLPDLFQQLQTKIQQESYFTNILNRLRIESVQVKAEQMIDEKTVGFEKKLEKERVNIIELLGIFTAVMSLILIGGTYSARLELNSAITLLSGLAAVLICFVSYLSLVSTFEFNKRKALSKLLDFRVIIFVLSIIYLLSLRNDFKISNFFSKKIENQKQNVKEIKKQSPELLKKE